MTRGLGTCLVLALVAGAGGGCANTAKSAYCLSPPTPTLGIASLSRVAAAPELASPPSPNKAAPLPDGQVVLASSVDSAQPTRDRSIIYTARLTVSTVDIEAALASAQKLCTEAGGYMDALTSESITMRVPAPKLFAVLDDIRKLGQVLSREINAQDVTDEYVDLRLRLENAEATRDRLLAILEKAQTVKDTLEVERELSRVREDIERIKGRLTLLDKQTTFSTITVNFARPAPSENRRTRPPAPFAWLDALGVERVLQLGY